MLRSGLLFNRGLRHAARTLPRVAVALGLTATGLSPTACYETKPLHLTVQTAATTLDCARTADRVFFDASYARVSSVLGPNVFYTPRLGPPRQPMSTGGGIRGWEPPPQPPATLGWGIGVWVTERSPENGSCGFALEGLSPDPACGPTTCAYSSQRGADVDEAVRDMTRRLAAAFE
jgi:hypothetical protein